MEIRDAFARFARGAANALGSPTLFVANVGLLLLWLLSGPWFGYSDTWQLLVNTVTTVFTYLAVFLIQNSQNRDARAMHLKLDELIASIDGARNRFVDLEDVSDAELEQLQRQFQALQQRAKAGGVESSRAIPGDPEKPAAIRRKSVPQR
jgi:low affinity Fe/Cu permease